MTTDLQRVKAGVMFVLTEKRLTDYELTVRAKDGRGNVVCRENRLFVPNL